MHSDEPPVEPVHPLPQIPREVSRLITDAPDDLAQRTATGMPDTLTAELPDLEDQFRTKKYQHDPDDLGDEAGRSPYVGKKVAPSVWARAKGARVSFNEHLHRHPLPVAFVSLIAGIMIGITIRMAHSEEPTLRLRFFR